MNRTLAQVFRLRDRLPVKTLRKASHLWLDNGYAFMLY